MGAGASARAPSPRAREASPSPLAHLDAGLTSVQMDAVTLARRLATEGGGEKTPLHGFTIVVGNAAKLMEMALKKEGLLGETGSDDGTASSPWEELLVGDRIGRRERESASMGAMGAAQWSGQFMTRPHCKYSLRISLLLVGL